MATAFEQLLYRMRELKDLQGLIGLATWDQETYLPPKAEGARAAQLATVQGLHHRRLTAPELDDLLAGVAEAPLDAAQRAMVRLFAWERDRARNVPVRLVQALAEAQSRGVTAWRQARQERRFAPFAAPLGELLALRREQADAIGHDGERYDALLEGYEPGMRIARLMPVLERLRAQLVPMVDVLTGGPAPVDVLDGRAFPSDRQWRFSMDLLRMLGFDLEAGRQDRSIHPFTGGTHPTDVRLTTKIDERNVFASIFGTIHEFGHGLYEQNFDVAHHRTPLAAAPSMGLHESQSRLWENIVGRSFPFWQFVYPRLRAQFPEALGNVSLETFHGAANRVRRWPIRIEADEVTYNLHVVLRTELEVALLRDRLPVEDLPEAWNTGMERLLGVRPEDDLRGVLQDIHWAWGELGYFPTYALGNLYAASLFRCAERDLPPVWDDIARGELGPLRDWLRTHVHRPGSLTPAEERVREVTGAGLTDADFLAYLREKYGALTGLRL